jgi:hypothetical protein
VDEQWVRRDRSPWPARLLALTVGLLVTGPALSPGYVLLRDMVFVPRQDLDLDALGLGGGLPRAVPVDAVMALVTAVMPGDLVQKAVLLGTVMAAVLGAARLIPPGPDGRCGTAAVVAGLVYGWSPYLAERLLIGHWTLLMAWAALPWIARAGLRFRAGEPGALPALVLTCVPAALSSSGTLLAAGVVLAVVGVRRAGAPLAALLLLALPWLVAGMLSPAGGASDPDGVAAFAARAEGWGGTLLSVLGTGGIWNAGAVPPSRASVLLPLVTVLLLALAAAGWLGGGALRGPGRRLVLLGVVGVVLACAGTLPGGADVLEAVVRAVPGSGILRDGQKWAAWWALSLAVGAGLGARRLADAVRGRVQDRAVAAVLAGAVGGGAVLFPLIAVPDLAWGVGGRLRPVDHPADWQRVRDVIARADEPGDVLVLPFGAYRSFAWNDSRPQLDPAPRWLPRPTVVDDELVVDGRSVAGEDIRARAVADALDDPRALAGVGVGWVLVEHGTPGRPVSAAITALPRAFDGDDLDLYRLPGAVDGPGPSPGRVTAVVLAHACALGVVVGAVLWIMRGASTVTLRRRPPRNRVTE